MTIFIISEAPNLSWTNGKEDNIQIKQTKITKPLKDGVLCLSKHDRYFDEQNCQHVIGILSCLSLIAAKKIIFPPKRLWTD